MKHFTSAIIPEKIPAGENTLPEIDCTCGITRKLFKRVVMYLYVRQHISAATVVRVFIRVNSRV
jgi:hypothetical protein